MTFATQKLRWGVTGDTPSLWDSLARMDAHKVSSDHTEDSILTDIKVT